MPKLQIELDDMQLDFLKQLTLNDKNVNCMGDTIRKLIMKEAKAKNIKYVANNTSADDTMNHLMNTIFGGFSNTSPFGKFK